MVSGRKRSAVGLLYVSPALLLVLGLLYAPSVYAFVYSLFDTSFLRIVDFNFPTNFVKLAVERDVRSGLLRSLVYVFGSLLIAVPAGLAISVWINTLRGWKSAVLQMIALIPWVISMVVAALLWRRVFGGQFNIASHLLELIGMRYENPFDVPRLSMLLLIGVSAWRTVGYAMVMLLSGLKGVPLELYEAASVDGASRFRQFLSITLPLIRIPLTIVFVILTLSYFNVVTVPLVLTGGGPGTATNVLSLELYRQAFLYYQFGQANALAVSMFIINMVFVLAYVRLLRGGTQ